MAHVDAAFGIVEQDSAKDGNPVLLLNAKDLLPSEAKALVAIEQPAGICHINF